jgi:hypothetical protein
MGVAQAFGIAPKGFGPLTSKGSAFGSSRPGLSETASFVPSKAEIPWFGIAVIVGVGALGAFLIYSASSASEKYVGRIHKRVGRTAGSLLRARSGNSMRALGTSAQVPQVLSAPYSAAHDAERAEAIGRLRGDTKLLTA